jgi:hypothetical protein
MLRVCDMMAFARARAPRALVTAEAFTRIEVLANDLPDVMSSYYFECRLDSHCNQVDLLGCVGAVDGGRDVLTAHLLQWGQCQSDPIWKLVTEFCVTWSDPRSPMHALVPHIWLAFDLRESESSGSPSAPCLLLRVVPAPSNGAAASQLPRTARDAQQFRQLIDALFDILPKEPSGNTRRKALQACYDLLPAKGHIVHVSLMLKRNPQTCKLNILLPKAQLVHYLTRVGMRDSTPEISAFIGRFAPAHERLKLQLVVNESVAETLELEFHFDESKDSQQRYAALLSELCTSGLCSSEKMDALRRWPGRFGLAAPGERWPTQWSTWTDLKITYQAEAAISAKGYLGFAPRSSVF